MFSKDALSKVAVMTFIMKISVSNKFCSFKLCIHQIIIFHKNIKLHHCLILILRNLSNPNPHFRMISD